MLNIVEWLDRVSSLWPLMSQKPSFLRQIRSESDPQAKQSYVVPRAQDQGMRPQIQRIVREGRAQMGTVTEETN
jgi:hypothetical protein